VEGAFPRESAFAVAVVVAISFLATPPLLPLPRLVAASIDARRTVDEVRGAVAPAVAFARAGKLIDFSFDGASLAESAVKTRFRDGAVVAEERRSETICVRLARRSCFASAIASMRARAAALLLVVVVVVMLLALLPSASRAFASAVRT
jgi:hypothetical protein